MKKITKKIYISLGIVFPLLLAGCSFFNFDSNSDTSHDKSDTEEEAITSFEILTDDILTYKTVDDLSYYTMTLYAGDTYQIRTNIDSKLGNTYYFKYESSDSEKPFTISNTGLVSVDENIENTYISTFAVYLYKKSQSRSIAHQYVSVTTKKGEYANITLINSDLTFDSATKTYSLTIDENSIYQISTRVVSNTSYVFNYSLENDTDGEFLSVSSSGLIKTLNVEEDKTASVIIKTMSETLDKTFDTVKLVVDIKNDDTMPEDELLVYDASNGELIEDGDSFNLFEYESMSFSVKYNKASLTNVITIEDSTILDVDNETNKITAKKVGASKVTFVHEEKRLEITINVIENALISIYSPDEENGFLVINSNVLVLSKIFVKYQSDLEKEITDLSLITFSIENSDDSHKNVTISYSEGEKEISNTYTVKWYQVSDYQETTTSYNFADLNRNYYTGEGHTLSTSGNINLLVIPVWFNNSDTFFNESQQPQIIEDINHTLNDDRDTKEYFSLKTYYEIESHNKLHLNSVVSDFYYSDTSYTNYSDMANDSRNANSHTLASDAIDWYFESHMGESFSDYDADSDGKIDSVILFYGSNYYGNKNETMRSTAFESTNHGNSRLKYNTMAFVPIGNLYGVNNRTADPTKQKASDDLSTTFQYGFRASSRTVIHEVGHMFGNKDLYENTLNSERYSPAGSFSMQDNNVGSHDPLQLNLIGWSKPQIYAASDYAAGEEITIHIKDFQSSGENIILSRSHSENTSLFDEYLLLELFTPTGLNSFEKEHGSLRNLTSGIRLWHVNSTLTDYDKFEDGQYQKTTQIKEGGKYELAYSNYDAESEYDLLHWIRNNPSEEYNTNAKLYDGSNLFQPGDEFDMNTFKSQFANQGKLDNEEKLGWEFKVNEIYQNGDDTYGGIITLKRVDNTRTEFRETTKLNVNLDTQPSEGITEYGNDVFKTKDIFSLKYKYVTPPSYYQQDFPISKEGMCLFSSLDGNGGYIDITILDIDGKEVLINSVSITYSQLTKAKLTAYVNDNTVSGTYFTGEMKDDGYEANGYKYSVNAKSIRLQNRYDGTNDYWSIIALYDLIIEYTIR